MSNRKLLFCSCTLYKAMPEQYKFFLIKLFTRKLTLLQFSLFLSFYFRLNKHVMLQCTIKCSSGVSFKNSSKCTDMAFYTGCPRKKCTRPKGPCLKWIKSNCDIKPTLLSQMKSWLLKAFYINQFGCCNPEIMLFSQNKSRFQRWMWSLWPPLIGFIDLDEANSIGEEMCENPGSDRCHVGNLGQFEISKIKGCTGAQ